MALPPPVTWAQRKNMIYVTFCVEDCKDAVVNIEASKVYFKGSGGSEHRAYENTLELYEDINAEESRKFIRDRNIELFLVKKQVGPYWPHLLKQKMKQHWLKVDFAKWKDEDDDEEEDGGGEDFEKMMASMGGLGGGMGGGMPGMMGGMGGGMDKPSLDDLDDADETDSDDEALPDLE